MRLSLKSEPQSAANSCVATGRRRLPTPSGSPTASYAGVPGKTTWMSRPFKRHC